MMLRWLLAAFHLLALGIGLGAVLDRAVALRGTLDGAGLRRVFRADAMWGIAALIWVATGLWRLFGGVEKGTQYYLQSHVFWTKMGLFVGVLALEIVPMVTLIRWRAASARGDTIDTSAAPRLARTSVIQAVLIVLMIFAAAAMARGIG
jgi:putative membrane protein